MKQTEVTIKVSHDGLTVTDNWRKLFFRRHYPFYSVSYCSMDPLQRWWVSFSKDHWFLSSGLRFHHFDSELIIEQEVDYCQFSGKHPISFYHTTHLSQNVNFSLLGGLTELLMHARQLKFAGKFRGRNQSRDDKLSLAPHTDINLWNRPWTS